MYREAVFHLNVLNTLLVSKASVFQVKAVKLIDIENAIL
jgi:hypothetical protein